MTSRIFSSRVVQACIVIAAGMVLLAPAVLACDTPVYRYALERWDNDYYQLVIYSQGPLTEAQEALLKPIEKPGDGEAILNVEIIRVDIDKLLPPAKPAGKGQTPNWRPGLGEADFRSLYMGMVKMPVMALVYPARMQMKKPIWTGPLTKENVNLLVFSPVRQEIVRRLVLGHATVWALLESGDKEADDKAYALLDKELKALKKSIDAKKASEEAEGDTEETPDEDAGYDEAEMDIPELEFSIIRLKRDDPKEKMFVTVLTDALNESVDENAKTKLQPVAFPFIGRGRVLDALAGERISKEEIEGLVGYILGPCSCEVKWQNPGLDMLIAADWDGLITGYVTAPKPLVDLASLPTIPVKDPSAANDANKSTPAGEIEVESTMLVSETQSSEAPATGLDTRTIKYLGGAGIILLALLALVAVLLFRRSGQAQ